MSGYKADVRLEIPDTKLAKEIKAYLESRGVTIHVNKLEKTGDMWLIRVQFLVPTAVKDAIGTPTASKVLRGELVPHVDEFAHYEVIPAKLGEIPTDEF